jgi:hypothetical protein
LSSRSPAGAEVIAESLEGMYLWSVDEEGISSAGKYRRSVDLLL